MSSDKSDLYLEAPVLQRFELSNLGGSLNSIQLRHGDISDYSFEETFRFRFKFSQLFNKEVAIRVVLPSLKS